MKIRLLLILILVYLNCFAQKPLQQFNTLNDVLHTSIKAGSFYSFTNNLFDGGLFVAKNKSNYIIDSGIVFPTANPDIVLVRKMNDEHVVKINWYGIKDSTRNFMPAFKKATNYLKAINGGTILFDAGTYYADPYFTIDANNIIVKGAGMNKTFIKASDKAGAGLMVNSNYRDAGWKLNTDDMITYKDDGLRQGQNYVDLRIRNDKNQFTPGTIIFINGGANYFDQNYGEFNIVDHCTANGRLFLKYSLSRSYAENISSWAATLTADFKPPAEGQTSTINFSGTKPNGGLAISIGNDLYKVVSSTANSAVVINTKSKGNSSAIIKAGTHIFKYRAIIFPSSVVYNVSVSDLTVTGKRKSVVVSNTFKTSFNNVRFNWLPMSATSGGIWLDGDDGRDFKMSNCEVNCPYLFSCQFARSFADIYIDHSIFNEAGLQFTEFNINANVTNCTFNLTSHNLPGEINSSVILLGNTCNAINFSNNIIHANNIAGFLFYSGEIQGSKAIIHSTTNINNNTIICSRVGMLFAGAYAGNVYVMNNSISGSVNYLFNIHAYKVSNSPYETPECIFKNNNFSGYVDGFGAAATNVQYIGNTIKRLSAANAPVEYNAWGNVLYTHFPADTNVINFVLKDNRFENWNLQPRSFSHYWPINERVVIENNHFINGNKDSVVTIKPVVKK